MKGLALFNPLLTDLSYTTHMFRIFFARCLAILMLLLSVQNAVGEVDEVLHHDIGAEHTLSVDVPNTDGETHEDNHCQHCCHSHASNIGVESAVSSIFASATHHFPNPARIGKLTLGPPTPPPIA